MNLEFDKVGVERSMIEGGAAAGGSREGPIAVSSLEIISQTSQPFSSIFL
jgi:hypothetical protein